MNEFIYRQVPLPDVERFGFGHKCSKCKKWSVNGIISYSDAIETTVFICKKCQPIKLIPAQIPRKSEFRHIHKCKECRCSTKFGIMTYCHRCESGEFVCMRCIANWFSNLEPEEIQHAISWR